jgi:hypothetical protein
MRCIAQYARRDDDLPLLRLYVHGGDERRRVAQPNGAPASEAGRQGFEFSRDDQYGRVTGWEPGRF